MAFRPESIDSSLKALNQWDCYKLEIVNGKKTKVPYSPATGQKASSTDLRTWTSFNAASAAYQDMEIYDGICFFVTEESGIVFIDLDDCIKDSEIEPWALEIAKKFNSYTERSQSGNGLHILIKGLKPGNRCKTAKYPHKVEIYSSSRQCCLTGDLAMASVTNTIEARQEQLDQLYTDIFGEDKKQKLQRKTAKEYCELPDDTLIQKALKAKNGQDFKALWEGDTSSYNGDESAADMALANMLAFWTGGNPEQMERLFSQSGLGQREKWTDRQDYRERTIQKAISEIREYYKPRKEAALHSQRQEAEESNPKGSMVGSIQINNQFLQNVTAKCMAALVANNDPPQIFSRAGSLVRLHHGTIQPLSPDALKNSLANATGFYLDYGALGKVKGFPPNEICKAILALSNWPGIPEIKSLIEIPVIRPDGSILSVPGYDEATQLYLIPIVDLSEVIIPDDLSQKHAEASARYIQEELFSDFPFSDEASKANMLALMLSVIVRPMIAGNIPLTILDKPQAGMGASLIADIVATVATGRPASMWGAPETEDEWRKAITSALISGGLVIVIDNVVKRLKSASLTRALTAKIWRDRLLGKNQMLDLPQGAVWIATGINIEIGGDIARRSMWIRFTSTCPRPWTRTGFKHPDILGWVKENHASIISNLLIMARAWAQAGCLDGTARLGGFNEWAKVISGILEFAGVKDFMGNAAQMYDEMDQDVQQWDAFLGEWTTIHADSPVSSGQLIDELLSFEPIYRPFQEAMPDDVATAVSRDRRASHSLGHALRKHLNQVYPSGRMLTGEIDAHSNSMKWMVCWVAGIKKESRNCNPQHQTVLGEVAGSAGSVPCGSDFPEISDTRKCTHAPTHVDRVGTLPADPAELFDDAVRCGSSGGIAGITKRIPQNRGKNLVCAKCGEDLTKKSSVEKNGKTYCTRVDCGFPARGSA